eukprot:m.25086 g.25086  ORF g.25086 m.25086 type:complete len:544 (-) comp14873_c1_seq1:8-1639(-)
MSGEEEDGIVDYTIAIVGGGPQSLAVLSALHEWYNFAFIRSHAEFKLRMGNTPKFKKVGKVCVVDPGDRFMEQWERQFATLEIKHLRSPMFAHPDAYDEVSLLTYATTNNREKEIKAPKMSHAGKGRNTKGRGDVGRVATNLEGIPSTALFQDFCMALAAKLQHTWIKQSVVDIDHVDGKYLVRTAGKPTIRCDAVVLALGICGIKNVPPPFAHLSPSPCVVHTQELFSETSKQATLRQIVRTRVGDSISASKTGSATVLVIGGGLCAAQAALAAHRAGAVVTLRSRRKLMQKDYDLRREWLDFRHSNRLRFDFLSRPMEERPQLLKEAVDGGSVPLIYVQELERLAAASSTLKLEIDPTIDETKVELIGDGSGARVGNETFSLVILATGIKLSPQTNPLLSRVNQKFPGKFVGALPVLNESLRWNSEHRIYSVGASSALEVGPGALNLMGAQRAGQLVAEDLQHLMYESPSEKVNQKSTDTKSKKKSAQARTGMRNNAFAFLAIDSDGSSSSEEEADADSSSSDKDTTTITNNNSTTKQQQQ